MHALVELSLFQCLFQQMIEDFLRPFLDHLLMI